MFIRSERLFLRPSWPEDWAELFALIDDEEVVRNLSRAPWPYRPEDARAFASLPQGGRFPHFFVTLPSGGGARLIGCVGLIEQDGEAELGYWIARQHWNRGYATEAVRAVLSLARTLGHARIVASQFLDNVASARVLAKVGFRPTGEFTARPCPARKATVPARVHVLELGRSGNCDNAGDGGEIVPAMRAA
jgi:RimJ/RimL family protein N-acetyltransferase